MKGVIFVIMLGLSYGGYRIWYGYDHPLGWILGITLAITGGVFMAKSINYGGEL